MTVIAIIDDRVDMRESVADRIRLGLEDLHLAWEVIADEPLASIADYPAWIAENGVCLLVLDEKLGEQIGSSGIATTYAGHEVAAMLRERLPDLPQLIITSIKNSDELDGAAELDAIVQRDEFDKHWRVHVERMVRLATRFVDRNEAELSELTDLSHKVVDHAATQEDLERLNALRQKVQMRAQGNEVILLREVLTQAEEMKERLKQVLDQLDGKISQ